MAVLVVIILFAIVVMACVGLLLSGIASIKQARLAKKMFKLRYRSVRDAGPIESDSD
jgi:hypothetical protein